MRTARPRRFAPSAGWSLLALAGFALFLALGQWQLDRASQKRALIAGFERGAGQPLALPPGLAPVERYRRLQATGRFDASRQFLLDNMTAEGRAGYRVLTPLVLDDGRVLMVDRGFVAGDGDRSRLPDVGVDEARRTVVGRADTLPRPGIELPATMSGSWPRIVGFPRIEELAAALGTPVYPQVLLLDADQPDGFRRDWAPPAGGPDRHLGYAVQWFAFAVTVVVVWIVLSMRREET